MSASGVTSGGKLLATLPWQGQGLLMTEGLGVGRGDGMQWGNPRVETAWVWTAVMRRGWGGWVWHGIGPSGWLRKRWTT